jgi:ABC-type transport system involved in cytochrome bd biosynthesis fused ATPase/permease subunit
MASTRDAALVWIAHRRPKCQKKQVIAIVDDGELASEGTIDLSPTEIVEIFTISNF